MRALGLPFLTIILLPCPSEAQLPETGCEVPELVILDQTMQTFMATRGIDAGLLGVMKDGVVVFERGYGWKDPAHSQPLPEDAMMRLASVTKPLTASAVRRLVAAGAFSLQSRVFDLGQPGGGLLQLPPFPSLGDPRLAEVTVSHCLLHTAGWDRELVGDLTYAEVAIATAMSVPSPPGRLNTVRYILGQPLQHFPGSVEAYSNIGYLVLGLIVEDATGMPLVEFLRQEVLRPLGVLDRNLEAGRTFPVDCNPREPWYEYPYTCRNVFDPQGPWVRCPDGGWDHEARVGQGGLIATTRTLLRFLDAYQISGSAIGAPRTGLEGASWRRNHTGSLRGSSTLARQRGDGVNYAVLFNERALSGADFAPQIRDILDPIFDGITQWPTHPPCRRILEVPVRRRP